MNRHYQLLVSPFTHKKLYLKENLLVNDDDGAEQYPIVNGVPVMLDRQTVADWNRELIEVLLWKFPDELAQMHKTIDWSTRPDPAEVFVKIIKKLLKDKDGICNAIEEYAQAKTDEWIVPCKKAIDNIPEDEFEDFKRLSSIETGKSRVLSSRQNGENGWAVYLPLYKEQVCAKKLGVIVELSTGAGFGTSAIADNKDRDSVLFTVDIDFACHGNVVGISKFLGVEDSLLSVCANFWNMPFGDGSVDVVCSNFGLDESRENNKTIAEVSRMLKSGGKFVNTSRKNAFIRQYNILEPFGFHKEEAVELLKKARVYSDTENLIEQCRDNDLLLQHEETFNEKFCVTTFVKK